MSPFVGADTGVLELPELDPEPELEEEGGTTELELSELDSDLEPEEEDGIPSAASKFDSIFFQ